MTNAQDFAAMINGREYTREMTREEERVAEDAGLVAVFGASDDLMEFRGAIHDEIGSYGGGTAYLTSAGLLTNDCDNDDCPHFKKLMRSAATIDAEWDSDGYSWFYETTIPHATFDVLEDGENYCRGIVFALADVSADPSDADALDRVGERR